MGGEEADICFTSPPYAQQRDYKTGPQDWDVLMQGVFSILPAKRDAQVLVNLGLVHHDGEWSPYWDGWIEWMRSDWRRFGWYVWDKGPGMAGDWNGRLAPSHEFIFHFNRVAERARKTKEKLPDSIKLSRTTLRKAGGAAPGSKAASPQTGMQPNKIPDSVIRVMSARGLKIDHPAVFPVELVSEILGAFSDAGDLAFEPFCGSGTQLIAAERDGRRCHAVEIAGTYCDVAVKRWSEFTGRAAVLADDGRTFDEVSAARKAA
jgi:DNA modification methylase